jgi:hypothetical protein
MGAEIEEFPRLERLMLDIEFRYLASHRDELLKQYGGKILVISGEQVTGAFDTIEEALQVAGEKHGLKDVLIRRPSEAQLEFSAPALSLGLLSADPAQSDRSSR